MFKLIGKNTLKIQRKILNEIKEVVSNSKNIKLFLDLDQVSGDYLDKIPLHQIREIELLILAGKEDSSKLLLHYSVNLW